MLNRKNSRRDTIRATVVVGLGVVLGPSVIGRSVRGQTASPISIDRTVGDLVVLPATQDATVTGTSTLEPGTDFEVRVSSRESPSFLKSGGAVVAEDGTWSVPFDLSVAVDEQEITIGVIYNNETVTTASGEIGPLSASLSFESQEAMDDGTEVRISEGYLELGGFIAIHEDGETGPIIGISEFLSPDTTYTDLPIPLETQLTGDTALFASAHLDTDANQVFDYQVGGEVDRPYQRNGEPVTDQAIVSGVSPQPSPTRSPTETDPGYTLSPETETPRGGSGIDVGVGGAGGLFGAWALQKLTNRNGKRGKKDRLPTAQIVHTPQNPEPGRPVLFDAGLSFDPDPDDRLVGFTWTIGNQSSIGKRVVHVFGISGDVDVKLVVRNSRGVTASQTKTVRVEVSEGVLELTGVHPDSPGDDRENLHEEYIVFTNTGNAPLELEGWTIYDAAEKEGRVAEGDHTYEVPEGVTFDPDEILALHTGLEPEGNVSQEDAADHHLYWGHHRPIWNNESDVVVVADADDNPVLATRYNRTENGSFDLANLHPGGLRDWFPEATVEVPDQDQPSSVTVDTEVGRTAISNLVDIVAGAVFLRGTKAFVRSWGLISSFLFFALLTWFASTATHLLSPSISGVGPLLFLIGSLAMTFVGVVIHGLRRLIGYIVGLLT